MYAALAKAVLDVLKGLLDLFAQRSALNNSPEMKRAAIAQTEIDARSRVEKALAKGDEAELRRAIAE